jgi:bacteriocin-type transport-associated protein
MTEVLLQELSNADVDWLIATGRQQQISAGTILLEPRESPEAVHVLLDGALTLQVPHSDADCADDSLQAGSASAGNGGADEIARLSRGEMVGETLLFNARPIAAVVRAVENSIILSIPRSQIVQKLQQDIGFSAHFYRAIALILSERLRHMLEMPGQLRLVAEQPVKDALYVFGELRDSDLDWLTAVGHLEKLAPRQVLIQAGRPVDALHIILGGLLSVAVVEGDFNPLTVCFECVEKNASLQKVISYKSKGEMSGTISFLDFRPSPVTVRAVDESLVLSIPRSQLAMKFQQDLGFASRFYRVLAIQLLEILQTAIGLLGCPQQMYGQHQDMDDDVEYDDELNLDALHQVAQGAARFNWMLKRLGVV